MSSGPQRKRRYKIQRHPSHSITPSFQPTSPPLTPPPNVPPPLPPAATLPSTPARSRRGDAQSQLLRPSPSPRASPSPAVSGSPPHPPHHPETAHSRIHFALPRSPPLRTPPPPPLLAWQQKTE